MLLSLMLKRQQVANKTSKDLNDMKCDGMSVTKTFQAPSMTTMLPKEPDEGD